MKRGVFIFWTIFVAAAGFRLWQSYTDKTDSAGLCERKVVEGTGGVVKEPQINDSGQILVVEESHLSITNVGDTSHKNDRVIDRGSPSKDGECPSGLFIRMKTKSFPRFEYGDQVSFSGKLLPPMDFESDNGRTFDYTGYLAKDDIFYEIKSAKISLVGDVALAEASDRSIFQRFVGFMNSSLFLIKNKFVTVIKKTLGEPQAALASGLLVGGKSALGSDLIDDFRRVGLIHIVTLSGYNITIVADAVRRVLMFLPRVWGIGVGGIGIALFGVMVGGGATVVRSCFMAGVALSADLIRRDYDVVRALVFAGLIMLIQNPKILLHDVSFQLSFMATLGLVILGRPMENWLWFITDRFGLRGIIASTLATQIFVSPFLLYIMGQLSTIGILANLLLLPLIPITMFLVAATGIVGMLYLGAGQVVAHLANLFLSLELSMVHLFSKLSFASVDIPPFSGWWVVGSYLVITIILIIMIRMRTSDRRYLA